MMCGTTRTDQTGQQKHHTVGLKQAAFGFGKRKTRVTRGDANVARQRDFNTDTAGQTVHRTDDRFGQGQHGARQILVRLEVFALILKARGQDA
jgi:hypothetical protein